MKTITTRKSALQKIRRATGKPTSKGCEIVEALDLEYEAFKDWDAATRAILQAYGPPASDGGTTPQDAAAPRTASEPTDDTGGDTGEPGETRTPEERIEAMKNGELPYDAKYLEASAVYDHEVYHPTVMAKLDGVAEQVWVGKPATKEKAALKRADNWIADYENLDEAGRRKALGWKPAAKTKPAAKAKREKKPAGERKQREPRADGTMSLIDAAASLLAATKKPMNVKDMVAAAAEKGLWQPGAGKTPENTLYASILREVNMKGDKSRFAKAGPGLWTRA